MEKAVTCTLDNLVIYVYNIRPNGFEVFRSELEKAEMLGKIPRVRFSIGKGFSEYHYKVNVGEGAGAISIGYKHNSAKNNEEFYTMRIEFNPAKNERMFSGFWDVFKSLFIKKHKAIKQFDLAFDVPLNIRKIFAISLTGRTRSYFKDTLYFGSSGNHGRLKIYDKKKELEEKQKIKIDEERTRVEYTFKFEEPVTLQLLSKCNTTINEEYSIVMLNEELLSGETKAAVLAVHNSYMQMNEFTRTTKTKIKKALDSMEQLDFDHAYSNAQNKIIQQIGSHFK